MTPPAADAAFAQWSAKRRAEPVEGEVGDGKGEGEERTLLHLGLSEGRDELGL